MLFELYFASDWIKAKAVSLYQNIDVVDILKQTVSKKLKTIADKHRDPFIMLIWKLIQA
jgi:hypothetical protein